MNVTSTVTRVDGWTLVLVLRDGAEVVRVTYSDGANPSLVTYAARAAKRAMMLPGEDYYRLLRQYLATADDAEADRLLSRVLAAGAALDGAR